MRLLVFFTAIVLPVLLSRTRIKWGAAIVILAVLHLVIVYIFFDLVGEAHEEFDPFAMLMGAYILSHRPYVSLSLALISIAIFSVARRIKK